MIWWYIIWWVNWVMISRSWYQGKMGAHDIMGHWLLILWALYHGSPGIVDIVPWYKQSMTHDIMGSHLPWISWPGYHHSVDSWYNVPSYHELFDCLYQSFSSRLGLVSSWVSLDPSRARRSSQGVEAPFISTSFRPDINHSYMTTY